MFARNGNDESPWSQLWERRRVGSVCEKEWFLSWEWKSEGVMDDVSGYSHWLSLWITAIARSRCPLRAPVRNVPLIQFLISVLYIVCLFMSYASLLIFFLHFFLTYLLPYLSFSWRIDPLRFQAGCLFKRRLNLALVFLYLFCSTFYLFCV